MVTRIWGKADSFELVFSPVGDSWEQWSAAVPADLQDGQYVVELYCSDDGGNTAYWTGILYLNKSANVQVRIIADKFKVWLEADIETKLQRDQNICLLDDSIKLKVTYKDYTYRG